MIDLFQFATILTIVDDNLIDFDKLDFDKKIVELINDKKLRLTRLLLLIVDE